MFERFTDRARRVVVLAQDEARTLNHDYIGTEHLLLGLLREEGGVAAQVLNANGVTLEDMRSKVETAVGPGPRPIAGEIGLTPKGKKVIEEGVAEARRMKHHWIGTEHLLLGLLAITDGLALSLLVTTNIELPDKLREGVMQRLAELGQSAAPPSTRKDNVISCRVDDELLEIIDALVDAGIRSTRSDAAGWLMRAGASAHTEVLNKAVATAQKIRELRTRMQQLDYHAPLPSAVPSDSDKTA